MKNKKKTISWDLILIAALVLAGLLFGLVLLLTRTDGKTVEIRVSGEVVQQIPLSESGTYEIEGTNGSDVLVIENGKAHMEEASCPDGVCLGMGEIDSTGESIICLPNEIVVEITDDSTDTDSGREVDAVTGGKQS